MTQPARHTPGAVPPTTPDRRPPPSPYEGSGPLREPVAFAIDAVLHAYSQVLFAESRPLGVLLLLASFVVPSVGLMGLAGVVLAGTLAIVLQMDRHAVRSGVLGYNALLVFLAIGAMLEHSLAFWALAAVTAALVVVVHVSLSGALTWHFRLPVLSLPFVVVTWLLMASVPHVQGMAFHGHPPALDLGAFPGPLWMDSLLRSLGAIFFQPHWTAGALVFAAMLAWSRVAVVHALVGFSMAVLADQFLFNFPPEFLHVYIGFNFIVTAVALGGIYYVPSASSLFLAAGGSLATGLVGVGVLSMLQPVGLPVLAMPFNLVVLAALYALGQRTHDSSPRSVDFFKGSPEDNLAWFRTRVRRFTVDLSVRMQLPFRGTWVVTQGNDGEHTHQGPWRHGLDFEVMDAEGFRGRGSGDRLEDWYCYKLPVTACAAGTVVRVVDGHADNLVGHVDTEHNWGNLVMVQHGPALFSMVAHLSPGSLQVVEGQQVVAGQVLGLCGSSGRSPIPHLHFQLQSTPFVGDATTAVSFHGVVHREADSETVQSSVLPAEGETFRNLARDPQLAGLLAFPPGRRLTADVSVDGKDRQVELVSELDLLGNRSLRNPATGAVLWFENRGDAFLVYDVTGPADPVLAALYAGLLRVPLDSAQRLSWTDILEPRRIRRSAAAWLADALSAFVPTPDARMRYRLERRNGTVTVTGETADVQSWQPEVSVEVVFDLANGLDRLAADLGGLPVEIRALREAR